MQEGAFSVLVVDWATASAGPRAVRQAVFVRELGVPPALEYDAADSRCEHVLAVDAAGRPIGTGRLLPEGRMGRMAVLACWRGRGVGAAMLRLLLDRARRRGLSQTWLHAQLPAAGFYARHGFRPEGPEFLEAGIAHVAMRLSL